jgi:hypothetical protein
MTFAVGYLTDRESSIWDLRRKMLSQAEIGRRLGITRQAVNKSLGVIDSKTEQAFLEAAEANKLEIRRLNLVEGIMEAYSPAYRIPVVVSLSRVNGLRIWHLYEGRCGECGLERSCRRLLLAEAEERGIRLTSDAKRIPPTLLALRVFSKYVGEDISVGG